MVPVSATGVCLRTGSCLAPNPGGEASFTSPSAQSLPVAPGLQTIPPSVSVTAPASSGLTTSGGPTVSGGKGIVSGSRILITDPSGLPVTVQVHVPLTSLSGEAATSDFSRWTPGSSTLVAPSGDVPSPLQEDVTRDQPPVLSLSGSGARHVAPPPGFEYVYSALSVLATVSQSTHVDSVPLPGVTSADPSGSRFLVLAGFLERLLQPYAPSPVPAQHSRHRVAETVTSGRVSEAGHHTASHPAPLLDPSSGLPLHASPVRDVRFRALTRLRCFSLMCFLKLRKVLKVIIPLTRNFQRQTVLLLPSRFRNVWRSFTFRVF